MDGIWMACRSFASVSLAEFAAWVSRSRSTNLKPYLHAQRCRTQEQLADARARRSQAFGPPPHRAIATLGDCEMSQFKTGTEETLLGFKTNGFETLERAHAQG
jgi:hypothetical protein